MFNCLTTSDLQEIRTIVEQVVQNAVEPIQNELKARRNDIKEIYGMIAEIQKYPIDTKFEKLSLEKQILDLHSKLIYAAKQAGVKHPSQ